MLPFLFAAAVGLIVSIRWMINDGNRVPAGLLMGLSIIFGIVVLGSSSAA